MQTAEQSLLKANLIVSGQSKQLDDLRNENEQLIQKISELEDQIKAYRYEASDAMHSASLDSERYRSEALAEFESIQGCLLESECREQALKADLEGTRKLYFEYKDQCSALETENHFFQSQLEAITGGSHTTMEEQSQARIKQLESDLEIKSRDVLRLQHEIDMMNLHCSNSTKTETGDLGNYHVFYLTILFGGSSAISTLY